MAGSIGPMERDGLKQAGAHVLGGLLGGIFLGFLLASASLVGDAIDLPPYVVVLFLGILGVLQAIHPRLRLGVKRQVPMHWQETLGQYPALVAYGVALGLGFVTQTKSYVYWGVAALSLWVEPSVGLAMGLTFGLTRALGDVALSMSLRSPEDASVLLSSRLVKPLSVAVVLLLAVVQV